MAASLLALASSWWSSRPRMPLFGRCVVETSKTLGRQMLMYHSAYGCQSPGTGERLHDLFFSFFFFFEETAIICLEVLNDFLNFTGGLSTGKSQTEDSCLVFGSYWYTNVSLPVTTSQTRSDLPPSDSRGTLRRHSPLPLLRSAVSWWGTQWA